MIDQEEMDKLYGTEKVKLKLDKAKEIYCLMREALHHLDDKVIGKQFTEQFEKAKDGLQYELETSGHDTDKIYDHYQMRCVRIVGKDE